MTVAPLDPERNTASTVRTRAQAGMPLRAYPFRILGMGLANLPLMAVMHEQGASWVPWSWMILSCLAWPHIAYWLASRSDDPFRAELRNLVIDSAIAGSWVPLLHFNLLPSAVLISVVIADKINTGVKRLWAWSLPAMLGSMLVCAWLSGFTFQLESSMLVTVASLPLLVIHTIAVSASSYRLVRRVQIQNKRLEELNRVDTLTALYGRGHWESLATTALNEHDSKSSSTLMVLDVDHFKEINDQFGHAAGDDVLRGIADLIRRNIPGGSHAGRLGGDEFAVVMPYPLVVAESTAERIRIAVHRLEFANANTLRCTVSIGIAGQPVPGTDLRAWTEIADRALYRAKQAGRNQAVTS